MEHKYEHEDLVDYKDPNDIAIVCSMLRNFGFYVYAVPGRDLLDAEIEHQFTIVNKCEGRISADRVEKMTSRLSNGFRGCRLRIVVSASSEIDLCRQIVEELRDLAKDEEMEAWETSLRIVDYGSRAMHNNAGSHGRLCWAVLQVVQLPKKRTRVLHQELNEEQLQETQELTESWHFKGWLKMEDAPLGIAPRKQVEYDEDSEEDDFSDVDESEDLSDVAAYVDEADELRESEYAAEKAAAMEVAKREAESREAAKELARNRRKSWELNFRTSLTDIGIEPTLIEELFKLTYDFGALCTRLQELDLVIDTERGLVYTINEGDECNDEEVEAAAEAEGIDLSVDSSAEAHMRIRKLIQDSANGNLSGTSDLYHMTGREFTAELGARIKSIDDESKA